MILMVVINILTGLPGALSGVRFSFFARSVIMTETKRTHRMVHVNGTVELVADQSYYCQTSVRAFNCLIHALQ